MFSVFRKIRSFYGHIKVNYLYHRNIKRSGIVNVSGIPILVFHEKAKLVIGKDVYLKSNKESYFLNMHSPVKIIADRKDAKIEIGSKTRINGACIHAYNSIIIGKGCLIAANCQIIDGSGHDLSFPDVENRGKTKGHTRPIVIEDNVWIGANSIILPGVKIGTGSIIGAGSVVTKNVPSMSMAAGNPAKLIRSFNNKNEL